MSEVLTISDFNQLAPVLDAAARSAKVRWLMDDDITIAEGTARHIVAGQELHQFHFIGKDVDVRDAFLRITTTTGMEIAVPVRRLMDLVSMGGFAVDS